MRSAALLLATLVACKTAATEVPQPRASASGCTDGVLSCADGAAARCVDGGLLVVNTCRGPAGCTAAGACDDSLAEEGDVCATPHQPACKMDRSAELFCEDGGYVKRRACLSPCETLDAGIRCE